MDAELNSTKHQKLMKSGVGMRVHIADDRNHPATSGEIRVQFWTNRERTLRAIKLGGLCWCAALISVIIPLLHFVLVPSLLLAGPILAFIVLGQRSVVLGGEGICPNCQAFLPIARTAYQFPISDICAKCYSSLKINEVK
jgi:hypothetical protein